MLFNSITFLVLFLPFSLLVYYLLGRIHMQAAKFWLIFVSFLFYGWWNPGFLALLAVSILFNYACGYLIQATQGRPKIPVLILLFAILANLSLLFYYKYLMTMLKWFNELGFYHGPEWGSLVLPLGISFFTFTQIGFLIDAQGGNAEERGFLEYALFVTFFPHLIAGPILHHREIMPQFAKRETYFLQWRNLMVGASIFIIGLGKKVIIADQLIPLANDVFSHPGEKHVLEAWAGVIGYSFQLYFDFSGYSEMALGLARMFNVTFPANFDSPFKSKSIIEFWQRWHISLTRYFTLYLYNPVSLWIMRRRAARGLAVIKAGSTTGGAFFVILAVPTLYTMILMGIWHGAGFQFFFFGLLNGIYLCLNHAWRLFGPKPKPSTGPLRAWLEGAWKWCLTYLSVAVALIFFKAKSDADAWSLIGSLFGRGTGDSPGGAQGAVESVLEYFGLVIPYWNYTNCLLTLGTTFLLILTLPNILQLFEKEGSTTTKIRSARAFFPFEWNPTILWGCLLGLLALADLLLVTGTTEFLYFRL